MELELRIPCVPVAQPRQRHRTFMGKTGHVQVQNYTPTKAPVNVFKTMIRMEFARHRWPVQNGPIEVEFTFLFPRPKRLVWKKRPMPECWHISKPDTENVVKAGLDALTALAFRDDAQVCSLTARKRYCAGDEQPCVKIRVKALEERG